MAVVNQELCKNNPGCMFVTLFLGFLRAETGVLRFANAGHLPPWHIAFGTAPIEVPCPPGPPLGIIPGARYRDHTGVLGQGDTLVVITDGLPEMMDEAGTFYTLSRVVRDMADLAAEMPRQIVTGLADRVLAFRGNAEQADDVTALAVRMGARLA
jgi:sigma-B regulation protein RsbU (phosphoserine phosphatase)